MRRFDRRLLIIPMLLVGAMAVALPSAGRAQGREVRVDPLVVEADDQSLRITGHDPDAPRALVLWRFEAGAFRRLATRQSAADGRFDFGEQSWPISSHRLHVVPAGVSPEGSRSVQLERRVPSPRILSSGIEPTEIEIAPALREGVILVRDAESGRLLLRRVVATDVGQHTILDLTAEGVAAQTDRVTLEHVLEDGRRSPPIRWSLDDGR